MISLGREPQVANVFYDPSPGGATDTIIGLIPSIASPLLIFPRLEGRDISRPYTSHRHIFCRGGIYAARTISLS